MGRPHVGQSNAKIKKNIQASETTTYRVAGWLSADVWDDMMNSYTSAPPEALEAIDQVSQLMHKHQIKITVSVDQRAGEEPKEWPTVMRFTLNPNEPEVKEDDPFAI